MPTIFEHVPHPHIARRQAMRPPKTSDQLPHERRIDRFNTYVALKITAAVGTMWCAYAFALLALVSLPTAWRGGVSSLITWTAQTFLQLVLLSIIIVGQNVQAAASDERAENTYQDAEAVLHEALQIQEHLLSQDQELARLITTLSSPPPAT